MPLQIVRNDITRMQVDAVVNAANKSLRGGGGVDGCIHRAAGPELLEECISLGGCNEGDAKVTSGYNMPCKYIIHTVGPVYTDGTQGEEETLKSCYLRSLELACSLNCQSIAFPLISSGAFGYPKDKALKVAVDTIGDFLLDNDILVYLVVFDKTAFNIGEKLFADIKKFIDDRYVMEHSDPDELLRRRLSMHQKAVGRSPREACDQVPAKASFSMAAPNCSVSPQQELEAKLKEIDESFSQMLLRKIDEKGMKDSQCYKKANIDRKLFSKIRSDIHYKPKKSTALAFAIALELNLNETAEFLKKAGFALSHSNKSDIIIEYFITKRRYDIFEINEALFSFDQPLLGG